MGGLGTWDEEFREHIQDKGWDDPLLYSSAKHIISSNPHINCYVYNPPPDQVPSHGFKSSLRNKKITLKELTAYNCLITVLKQQLHTINTLYENHEPRSASFIDWFEMAKSNVTQRYNETCDYLSNFCKLSLSPTTNNESLTDQVVSSRLLEYAINHILKTTIKPKIADRTEIINIIEDATYYISLIEGDRFVLDKENSIWTNYIKSKFNLAIRDDHCCQNCGNKLFSGIPYCMTCHTQLSR